MNGNNDSGRSGIPDGAEKVSTAVIRRLPRYFRYLRELLRQGRLRISSGELSKLMHVTATQIRQDLNCFGGFGQQGYGYNVKYLYAKISEILGVERGYRAIIIGAGNFGRSLSSSTLFDHRGVKLTALFDIAPEVIGKTINGFCVLDARKLEEYCAQNRVDIGVLTLPRPEASGMAARLSKIGIRGIWNFTGAELELEKINSVVETVHMGDSLMTLCYRMNKAESDTDKKQ